MALSKAWGRTLRIETPGYDVWPLGLEHEPLIIVLWHNRLFVVPELQRRLRPFRKIYALVSASKDGAWLAAFLELAGLGVVRGSSSKLGREAMHALAERLDGGDDIGITPDGPRGPAYRMKGGGLLLARKTGCPSLLVGINYERAWRVPSWDRFYLPMPWSTVRLTFAVKTAGELGNGTDAVERMQEDLIRLNPDELGPVGNLDRARPRIV